jgi:two-component system chemotaxis response regulator CheB
VANFSPRLLNEMVIGIGASTGGTEAIKDVLARLPAQMPPIVMVQHMPETFTPSFAKRLDSLSRLTVIEAQGGERLKPGMAYLAPGHSHLRVRQKCRRLRAGTRPGRTGESPPPGGRRAVHSLAEHLGKRALGMILTGMGKDGARACWRCAAPAPGTSARTRPAAWSMACRARPRWPVRWTKWHRSTPLRRRCWHV